MIEYFPGNRTGIIAVRPVSGAGMDDGERGYGLKVCKWNPGLPCPKNDHHEQEGKMKKLIAILAALCMLFSLSVTAMADGAAVTGTQPHYLSWESARTIVVQEKLEGRFVKLGDYDLRMWVPDSLLELKDHPDKYITYFMSEDKSEEVGVQVFEVGEEFSLEAYEQQLEEQGLTDGGMYVVNGYHGLLFMSEQSDNIAIAFMSGDDEALVVSFYPASNADFYQKVKLMIASIQPNTPNLYNLADMIDTDLMEFWGDNRKVTYNEPDNSIHFSVWDDGVNSDTIDKVNNWSAVRDGLVDRYNFYYESLKELGATDVRLVMQMVAASEDDDAAFLTIVDGEIVYEYKK